VRHLAWHGHAVSELDALAGAIAACPVGFEE